jgi:hypothetical protein
VAMKTLVVSALLLAACSKPNPDVCCTDAANCAAQGLSSEAMCSAGLVCRGNTCVAETCVTSDECELGAPFCASSGLCSNACEVDAECPGFQGDASHSYCSNGDCVQCRTGSDCTADAPVCDGGACRGCAADSECASGICGSTGACVDATDIVYLDPTGIDGGQCGQASPCKTITFAESKTSATRSSVLMGAGQYVEAVHLTTGAGLATTLEIHGSGAVVTSPTNQDSTAFVIDDGFTNVKIFGLTLTHQEGNGVMSSSPLELHSVTSSGGFYCILATAGLTAYDVQLSSCGTGVDVSGQLTVDGLSIVGNAQTDTGIRIEMGAVVTVNNLVVNTANSHCIDLLGETHELWHRGDRGAPGRQLCRLERGLCRVDHLGARRIRRAVELQPFKIDRRAKRRNWDSLDRPDVCKPRGR